MQKIFLKIALSLFLASCASSKLVDQSYASDRMPAQTGTVGSVKIDPKVTASCEIALNKAGGDRFNLDITGVDKVNTLHLDLNKRYSVKIHIKPFPTTNMYSVVLQVYDNVIGVYQLEQDIVNLGKIKSNQTSAGFLYTDKSKFPTEDFNMNGVTKAVTVGAIDLVCSLNQK